MEFHEGPSGRIYRQENVSHFGNPAGHTHYWGWPPDGPRPAKV
jgi:hypothetical protein